MDTVEKTICRYAQITDVGCVRELNEDSLYCNNKLWLVADGMGGHACGEVASQLAAQEIALQYAESGSLTDAIQFAHTRIIESGEQGIGQTGMGTTVVALVVNDKGYEIAWVGDSRAYLWDKKRQKLTQLSEDHSLIVRLIKSGLISVADAKNHPQRHMITQCLGSLEIGDLQIDQYFAQWKVNQQILLCSDGLTDEISDEEIANVLAFDESNELILERLVKKAKQAGGKDNISLILIDSPHALKQPLWEKLTTFLLP